MVGNNPSHDLPAGLLGIQTYLITGKDGKSNVTTMFHASSDEDPVELSPDSTGETLSDFLEWLKTVQ